MPKTRRRGARLKDLAREATRRRESLEAAQHGRRRHERAGHLAATLAAANVPRDPVLVALGDEGLERRAGMARAVGDEPKRHALVEVLAHPGEACRRLLDLAGGQIVAHVESEQRVFLARESGRSVPDELHQGLVERARRVGDAVAVEAVKCNASRYAPFRSRR
jgi:hypothetical protein